MSHSYFYEEITEYTDGGTCEVLRGTDLEGKLNAKWGERIVARLSEMLEGMIEYEVVESYISLERPLTRRGLPTAFMETKIVGTRKKTKEELAEMKELLKEDEEREFERDKQELKDILKRHPELKKEL